MDTKRGIVILALLVVAVAGLGFYLWRHYQREEAVRCDVCDRLIHEGTRTVALVDGVHEEFCCPSCALTLVRQQDGRLELSSVADFETAKALRPEEAWFVIGSEVNICIREQPLVGPQKELSYPDFDRCSPSILAFDSEEAAHRFAEEHGGQVTRWQDLVKQVTSENPGTSRESTRQ